MYAYKEHSKLFQNLCCEVSLSYIAAMVLLCLIFSHPLYLFSLFVALNMVILSAGIISEWLTYLKFSLMLIFLIILVNTLFVHAGATVLIHGPRIPIIGTIRITLEALCYGVGMGLRLLVMMGAFCLLTYAVHPDRVLKALGGGQSKIMLTLSISLRLFPLIAGDFVRITEAQRCRGVNFQARDPRVRIRKYVPVLNTVLLSSLERSFQLAESLQSRGYGTTRRTCYHEVLRRPRDYLVLMMVLLGLGYALILILSGSTGYSYYPRLQPVKGAEIIMAVGLGLFFMFPALLNWGWERCRFLKSKI
jgi:energy-coupling factor transport system permease protein